MGFPSRREVQAGVGHGMERFSELSLSVIPAYAGIQCPESRQGVLPVVIPAYAGIQSFVEKIGYPPSRV